MKQTLRISIARGGCRFATPLYLGGDYTLSFEGDRSDEAVTLLFVKPKSNNATKTDAMSALAQSTKDETSGVITLKLNKQALLNWFIDCGECDVDGYVDAHCYVFDAEGVILADSDVTIEYKPIQFAIDSKGFDDWSDFDARITAVEEQAKNHDSSIDKINIVIKDLESADIKNLAEAKSDATEKVDNALQEAKTYADNIKTQLARMQYVKCDEESTETTEVYHHVFLTKNEDGEHVITVDETPCSIEGTDPTTTKYVYIDTKQTITGQKTFQGALTIDGSNGGSISVPTKETDDNSTAAASTAFVQARLEKFDQAFTRWWGEQLLGNIEWQGQHTFDSQIKANGGVKGDLTGNVTATKVDTVNLKATDVDTDTLNVTGAETHSGAEMHSGAETHSGLVTLENVQDPNIKKFSLTGMSSDKGLGVRYVWNALKMMAQFMTGKWAHGAKDSVSFATSTTKVEWRDIEENNSFVNLWATKVLDFCFYHQTNLYHIYLPNVTSVGAQAFESNTNLRVFPIYYEMSGFERLVSAGRRAFYDCNNIAAENENSLDYNLFPSLEYIGDECFNHCSNITKVNLRRLKRAGTSSFSALGDITSFRCGEAVSEYELHTTVDAELLSVYEAFDWCKENSTSLFSVINEAYGGIDSIPYTFFCGQVKSKNKLTEVVMPTMQLLHQADAFYDSSIISNIELDECIHIGYRAFMYNGSSKSQYPTGLVQNLRLPKCIAIEADAFGNSNNNAWDYFCRNVYAPKLQYINSRAFYMIRTIEQFYAPELKYIGACAFWGCISLVGTSYQDENGNVIGDKDIVRFDNCLAMGDYAFSGRSDTMAMKKLSIAKCEKIGIGAFNNSDNLTDIYMLQRTVSQVLSNATSSTSQNAGIYHWGLSTTVYKGDADGNHTSGVAIHCGDGVIGYAIPEGATTVSWTRITKTYS